jgi:hypothetical protein
MRRVGMLGLVLLVFGVSSVVGSSPAFAHPAGSGVCYKKKGGFYSNQSCTKVAMGEKGKPAKGKYEWAPAGTCYKVKKGKFTESKCKKKGKKATWERAPLPRGKGKEIRACKPPHNGRVFFCWNQPTPVWVGTGEEGCTVKWEVTGTNTVTKKMETVSGMFEETEPGGFYGEIPPLKPIHGNAKLRLHIVCPKYEETEEIPIYIDPSGKVVDANHNDNPVSHATVTLLSSETLGGTYTPVPNGSEVMSEDNRVNPGLTGQKGVFGWETIEGFYKVEAAKTGCGTAVSEAFEIPPPKENLVLELHCAKESEDESEYGEEEEPEQKPGKLGLSPESCTFEKAEVGAECVITVTNEGGESLKTEGAFLLEDEEAEIEEDEGYFEQVGRACTDVELPPAGTCKAVIKYIKEVGREGKATEFEIYANDKQAAHAPIEVN